MASESSTIIAVFYGGMWNKGHDDRWEFKNYESELTEVPINCTYEQLLDEVYSIVNVDRSRNNLKMKFHFMQSCQPCAPQEIRRDKDVKIFLRVVKEFVPMTPLYVEILPIDVQEQEHDAFVYHTNLEEDQVRETYVEERPIQENFMRTSPICEAEYVHGVQLPETHTQTLPPLKTQCSNNIKGKSVHEDAYSYGKSSSSSRIGESRYMSIESGSSDSIDFCIGQVYDNKNELKQKLSLYAVNNNFQFKVVRSSTTRYEVICFDDTCGWRLRATKIPHSENLFIVKTYNEEHTCLQYSQAMYGNHRQATSRVIGEEIKEKYQGIARVYKPREIKYDFKLKHGVDISYDKAWRAREHALNSIRGTAEESFTRLPSYFAMLERNNPGTVTRIHTDDDGCFQYCFMALGASIKGFHSSIRPVVAVDGTTLKHRYRGYLYIASALDGNNQIFPLAFGVGDGENEDAYTWFFQCFREAYGEPDNLVFVSDRHKGIENALKVVYPNCYHGLCMYHINQNLRAKKFGHEDQILPPFYLAAKSYLSSRFDYFMNELRIINAMAVEYLSEIEVRRWARCKFPITRYNILTTNIAECMNAILRDAREMPLVPLLETIRSKLQQWFYERRTIGENMNTVLTTWTEERLKKRERIAQRSIVEPINPYEYRVIGGPLEGKVNLHTKSCTCRKFDLDQYPCVHGMAACLFRRIEFHNMCSHYYRVDTLCAAYAESIYPVGDTVQWEVPTEVQMRLVQPPNVRRQPAGRPRKNRILSQGEEKIKYKCSRCGKIGHNRARCTNPIAHHDVGTSGP